MYSGLERGSWQIRSMFQFGGLGGLIYASIELDSSWLSTSELDSDWFWS